MTRLVLAKRRTLRRRHQAGAAMFVVSMMVTVLAVVGMFALAAAATEVKTSGNERQSAQTHYLGDFGTLAFLRNSEQGRIADYINIMMGLPPSPCPSLPLPAAANLVGKSESKNAQLCGVFYDSDLYRMGQWAATPTATYSGATPYSGSAATPGSLGPIPSTPSFKIEMTDVYEVMGKGMGDGQCPTAFATVTSYGVTRPLFAGNPAYGSEGIELQRSRVVSPACCNCPPP